MNALVGQEAKLDVALVWLRCDTRTDNSACEDGSDLTRTRGGAHVCGRRQFEVVHDGSRESKPSVMVREAVRNGWQRIAMRLYLANLVSQEYNAVLSSEDCHARPSFPSLGGLSRESCTRGQGLDARTVDCRDGHQRSADAVGHREGQAAGEAR